MDNIKKVVNLLLQQLKRFQLYPTVDLAWQLRQTEALLLFVPVSCVWVRVRYLNIESSNQ
jgi:hypothetical protein